MHSYILLKQFLMDTVSMYFALMILHYMSELFP